MQSKESKKDSEKSQKKVKSNPETSLELNKSIKKVQSLPQTPIDLNKPLDQRIKEAQSLKMMEVSKSMASKNELPSYLRNPKSLARRAKQSKKKYEETYGKPSEKSEMVLGGIFTNQSITQKTETIKSSASNEDLSNENSEGISLLKKRDEALQFSFREFMRGPRDLERAISFITYLNSCEGEDRRGLVSSKWFLPVVTKAIRDLIDPSQLKVPMAFTN